MKNIAKANLWILLTFGMIMLVLTGCHNKDSQRSEFFIVERPCFECDSTLLVVERQYIEWDSDLCRISIAVDLPLKGPQPLLDSIKKFLFERPWFTYYDDDDSTLLTLSIDDTQITELSDLLASYVDKQKDVFTQGEFVENIFLIAQTESFVTYGVEHFSMVCSGTSSLYLQTFSKTDGHRIYNIIDPDDVARFDPYEDLFGSSCGLMCDGILVDGRQGADYETGGGFLPYEDVLPYLSQEAKDLVKNMGKISSWKDCFVGERLATVKTRDNKTIDLTVRPAEHDWHSLMVAFDEDLWYDEYGLTNNKNYGGQDLMAIYVDKDDFELAPVIDGKSVVNGHWKRLYSTNPNSRGWSGEDDVFTAFAFDSANNTLYIPYAERIRKSSKNCNDRYSVYRFNGVDRFVYQGEDGGFWLHPSLRQFGRLCYAGTTKDYHIRIDEMRIYDEDYEDQRKAATNDANRYRFAAWKIDNELFPNSTCCEYMINKPDIVINNGQKEPHPERYVFFDNRYKYVVNFTWDNRGDNIIKGWLEVYQKDKLIDKQDLEEAVKTGTVGLVRNDLRK